MISRWTAALLCAAPLAAIAQISPCGSGQQLGNNAVITSGNAVYSSPGYVSAGSLSVNVVGNSVVGNAGVTIQAGTAICLGPGFKAAATSSGGGFTALISSTPPAGAFAVTTTSLAGANQGASYQQTLNASGGIPSYTWSQAGGSLPPGLSLNSAGVIAGTAATGGTYAFIAEAQDAAGATATRTLSITVASVSPPSLSINGGSGTGQTLATVTVPLAFAIYDTAGANDIGYAQFYLADSSGNAHCYGEWGRQNALFLYDGNTGITDGFGVDQSDSFCTVSLHSITNSVTDPTEATVILNFSFNPGFAGTYSVMEQIDYVSGTGTSWQNVGP
jgi:hypothetical protein